VFPHVDACFVACARNAHLDAVTHGHVDERPSKLHLVISSPGYILCGTPRGRVRVYSDFVRAVRNAATTDNGVFAARVMWGSLERVMEGLDASSNQSDLVALERAFGQLAFVFLTREDVIDQAVSWSRAEQTGFWRQGDIAVRSPQADLNQMKCLVDTIREHNAAWRLGFDRQGIQPHQVTYEGLVRDPQATVEGIAAHLQVALPARWQPTSPHRKQADSTNHEWAAALRAALTWEGE
jgi:trehalose 2-sulfotransferase